MFREKWFIFALLSMFIVTLIDLTKKFILDEKMINPTELIIYSAMVLGIIGFFHFLTDKKCRPIGKMNKNLFFILVVIGILAYLFNIAFTKSIFLAPEASLTGVIISLNIIFVYMFSSIFFKKSPKFNFDVLVGLILILSGGNIISRKF
jgi:uncharacterized membrane protein